MSMMVSTPSEVLFTSYQLWGYMLCWQKQQDSYLILLEVVKCQ